MAGLTIPNKLAAQSAIACTDLFIMFGISEKVVCVNASPGHATGVTHLKEGTVYVVEGVNDLGGGDVGLWLVGQPRPWKTFRFRKLEDVKAERRKISLMNDKITHVMELM